MTANRKPVMGSLKVSTKIVPSPGGDHATAVLEMTLERSLGSS